MDGVKFQAARGHRLDPPGHPRGVSCGPQSPALGPTRLLTKTADDFVPRPVVELDAVLGRITQLFELLVNQFRRVAIVTHFGP